MTRPIRIAPSILSADFARLGEEVRAIAEAGADFIHIDVMDGHFVPNLTVGPVVLEALRPITRLPFDVHLMIEPAEPSLERYAEAGADIVTIHVEASPEPRAALRKIARLGKTPGLSLKPKTPAEAVLPYLEDLGLVLVMTVEPGFAGQSFMPDQLPKIRALRRAIDACGRAIHLEVDGGINAETARQAVAAGADVLVAGSATFAGGPARYRANIAALRGAAPEPRAARG
jgi:ribulose-phosphate 3-epimerase